MDFKTDIIYNEDCLVGMPVHLPDNCIDTIITDPPYGLSFMGRNWDRGVPPVEIWRECLRVLKPGSFAFVMSSPRQDVLAKMILNLHDAGFVVSNSSIYWTYATGWPKAPNISKKIDERAGVEREVVGRSHHKQYNYSRDTAVFSKRCDGGSTGGTGDAGDITAPSTEEAKAMEGSYGGYNPKPAVEVIIVAMVPLSEKTYVDQALSRLREEERILEEIKLDIEKKYGVDVEWE